VNTTLASEGGFIVNTTLAFLTSRKTTFLAVLSGALLLVFDDQFIALVHNLGVSDVATTQVVNGARLVAYVLAALGYSPLRKPPTPIETEA
jgi:hypothetical protein